MQNSENAFVSATSGATGSSLPFLCAASPQRPSVVKHLLCTLKTEVDAHATQYALTLLCEMLRGT